MAAYRNDVDALSARHDSLAAELAAKTRELNDASRLLEEARTRAKLPVLENIRVATPCHADWKTMSGDERTRFCGDCKKSVYNLSNMTRDDAEALLVEKEGNLCARYYQRHDGTILLKDCSIGIGKKRKRRVIALGAFALLGTGALYAFTRPKTEANVPTCANPHAQEPIETGYQVQGGVEAPPEPPHVIAPPTIDRLEVLGGVGPAPEERAELVLGDIK